MWSGQHKVWIHYRKDIIASDVATAIFLSDLLRYHSIHKIYAEHLEVIDLQKYKVFKKAHKVRLALKERMDIPFVFAVGKN